MGRVLLAAALALVACEFPAAFTCRETPDCVEGVCTAGRCVTPAADAAQVDAGSDATAGPDAAAVSEETRRLCAALCPDAGPCDGLVPLANPSFESDDDAWTFASPARRTRTALDGTTTTDGRWFAELRLDYDEVADVDTANVEQRLTRAVYPSGTYRLCFARRIASRQNNCYAEVGPWHRAYATDASAGPGVVVWELSSGAWCPQAPLVGVYNLLDWGDVCVEFERAAPWSSPGLRFEASRTGEWGPRLAHSFAIDHVRLQALACGGRR